MNLRPYTHVALVALFGVAVVCSVVLQAGHADVPVAESAELVKPLRSGDSAPRFIVETVAGEPFDFDPAKLQRPVVILTFRGGWCPYCNMYLSEMRNAIPEIQAMGIDVLFLSGDRPDQLFASLSQETQEDIAGLDYTLLSDADVQAARALGIAFKAPDRLINSLGEKGKDIEASSITRHGVLPVPAVFAIDREGIIQFAFTNADYKVRLPAAELLQAAKLIAAAD
jgi:peroxiredoxin